MAKANRESGGVCISALDADELLGLPFGQSEALSHSQTESDKSSKDKFHFLSDVTGRLCIQLLVLLMSAWGVTAQLPPRPIDGKLGLQDERGRMILDERGRHILPDRPPHYIVGGMVAPIEFWKLEEGSGHSRTGSIHHVTMTETLGGPAPNTSGIISNAVHLTGGSGGLGIQTGSNGAPHYFPELALTTNSFSICGWCFIEALPTPPPTRIVPIDVWFTDLAGNSAQKIAVVISNTTPPTFNVTALNNTAFGSASLSLSNWFFFRIWWSDSDSLCRLQVNDGTIFMDSTTAAFPTTLAGYVDFFALPSGWRFDVDEFGLWEPALTDAQGTALYNEGAGRTFP